MDTFEKKDNLTVYLSKTRKRLSGIAECGFDLSKTCNFVNERLTELNLNPQKCGKSGITALITGSGEKTLLIRADMDALPTEDGPKHLCGHDYHTAMLLGCAKILAEKREQLKCNVKLLFQPAEETLEGARSCIDAGILECPKVTAAVMMHVIPALPLPIGTVIIPNEGYSAPGACFFKITVKGKACHGAAPQNGIDSISVCTDIISSVNYLIAKEFFNSDALITICKINAGTSPNIIADKAEIEGTLRALRPNTFKRLKERMVKMCESISASHLADFEFNVKSECPPLYNSPQMTDFAYSALKESTDLNVIRADELGASKSDLGGSEDFSHFSTRVPSLMLALPAGDEKHGHKYPLHHPKVSFDDSVLPIGAKVLAILATQYK